MVEVKERGWGKNEDGASPVPTIHVALDLFHRMAEVLTEHPKLIQWYQLQFTVRLLPTRVQWWLQTEPRPWFEWR